MEFPFIQENTQLVGLLYATYFHAYGCKKIISCFYLWWKYISYIEPFTIMREKNLFQHHD